MGRAPCCDKANVKKGPWSPEEDLKLKDFIQKCGTGGNWIALPQKAGLRRCGKSCRLRWLNYLRPNIKHGEFSADEDRIICTLFSNIGSRWSIIASQMPGRTDNDIKNYWNTKLKKKLMNHHSFIHERKTPTFSSSSYYYNQQDKFLTTNYLDHQYQTSSLPSSFVDPTSAMQNYHQVKETTFGHHDHQVEASSCGSKGDQVQVGLFDQTSYCFNNNNNLLSNVHENGPNDELITRPTIMEDCYYYAGFEEIKQLISTGKSSLFSVDENKSSREYYYHY